MTCHIEAKAMLLVLVIVGISGCGDNMRDGARLKPYEPAAFPADQNAARLPVPGTVARGTLREESISSGKQNGQWVTKIPVDVTPQMLQRGRERFAIHCALCHGYDGFGQGMIVNRGFTPPPSLHEQRLRDAPAGHFFNVITHGYGAMYPYGARVKIDDRWAIIAYIRALQLSQNAKLEDVPESERKKLEAP